MPKKRTPKRSKAQIFMREPDLLIGQVVAIVYRHWNYDVWAEVRDGSVVGVHRPQKECSSLLLGLAAALESQAPPDWDWVLSESAYVQRELLVAVEARYSGGHHFLRESDFFDMGAGGLGWYCVLLSALEDVIESIGDRLDLPRGVVRALRRGDDWLWDRLRQQISSGQLKEAWLAGATEGGGSPKESRAMALLIEHPEWSNTKIAKEAGCSRPSLYRMSRFMAARQTQRAGRSAAAPRGSKYEGRVEAHGDEDW